MLDEKLLLYMVFLLRIFLPVECLNKEPKIDYSDEYKRLQDQKLREADAEFDAEYLERLGVTTELPEYSEYLRRLGLKEHNRQLQNKDRPQQKDSPLHAPLPFPSIQLCKERPADGDYYGHVFCWTMVALFAMSIISLIIYQVRSILWLKLNISRTRKPKEFELVPNGRQSDYKDNEEQSSDKQAVPRMLSF